MRASFIHGSSSIQFGSGAGYPVVAGITINSSFDVRPSIQHREGSEGGKASDWLQKQLRVAPGTEELLNALLTSPMMSLPVSKGEGSGEFTVTTTGTSHFSTPA